MTKRITAIFLAVAVLLLSGCSKRLSQEEYRDRLMDDWSDYLSAQMDIVKDLMTLDESGSLPSEFEDHCKAFEKAMKAFDKIKPPADMVYRHDLLLEALDNEREWLAAVRALTSADTPSEIEQAEQRIHDTANYPNSFPKQFGELITELRRNTSS